MDQPQYKTTTIHSHYTYSLSMHTKLARYLYPKYDPPNPGEHCLHYTAGLATWAAGVLRGGGFLKAFQREAKNPNTT